MKYDVIVSGGGTENIENFLNKLFLNKVTTYFLPNQKKTVYRWLKKGF